MTLISVTNLLLFHENIRSEWKEYSLEIYARGPVQVYFEIQESLSTRRVTLQKY